MSMLTRSTVLRFAKRVLALGSAAVVSVVLVNPAPAQAAGWGTQTQNYSVQQSIKSSLGFCVRVTMAGKMSVYKGSSGNQIYLKDPRIIEPRTYVAILAKCGDWHRKKAYKMHISARYYYSKCEVNPTVSASVPLNVSVTATPTCKREKVARRVHTFGKGSDYSLYSTGAVASWDRRDYSTTHPRLCIHASARVDVSKSSTKADIIDFNLGNICIKG